MSKSSHLGGKDFKITLWSVCISVYLTPLTRESSRAPLMSGNDKKSPYSNARIFYRLIKIVEVILLIQAAWSLKRKTVISINVSFSRRTISHFYWEIVVAIFPQPFGFQCVLYHSTRSRNNIWQDSCQSSWAYVSIVIVMKWEYGISSCNQSSFSKPSIQLY